MESLLTFTDRNAVTNHGPFGNQVANHCTLVRSIKGDNGWENQVIDEADQKGAFLKVVKFALENKRDILVFVPGFNTKFSGALDDAQYLRDTYNVEVITFSWPSEGEIAGYFQDREKAQESHTAFEETIIKIAKWIKEIDFGNNPPRISLMCHSMGNELFKVYIEKEQNRNETEIFRNITLASADVKNPKHKEWCEKVKVAAEGQLYVTINLNDYALGASSFVWHEPRLGDSIEGLNATNVDYIDFTGDVFDFFDSENVGLSHSPFRTNDKVIQKVFHRLIHGENAIEGLHRYKDNAYRLTAPPVEERVLLARWPSSCAVV